MNMEFRIVMTSSESIKLMKENKVLILMILILLILFFIYGLHCKIQDSCFFIRLRREK